MRIDYSEPRQTYATTGPVRQRPSNTASRAKLLALVLAAFLLFAFGFGLGWYFSQQAAKKSFRAAMEQQSLETGGKLPPGQQAPAADLQQGAPPAAQQTEPGAAPANPGELPLSFFDNLPKGQKNTVLGSGINERPKPTVPAVPVAPATPVTPTAPVASEAQQPTPAPAVKKVTPAPPAKPAPSAKPAPQPTGYVVQVASFSNRKEADSLKTRLVARGYAASVSTTTLEGKDWYRVRIGRHLDKEAATKISNQLMMGAKIVPDQE